MLIHGRKKKTAEKKSSLSNQAETPQELVEKFLTSYKSKILIMKNFQKVLKKSGINLETLMNEIKMKCTKNVTCIGVLFMKEELGNILREKYEFQSITFDLKEKMPKKILDVKISCF